MTKDYGFATRQIHGGHAKNAAGALTSPIYQSSTFVFDDAIRYNHILQQHSKYVEAFFCVLTAF